MVRASRTTIQRTTRGAHLDVSLNGIPRGRRGRALADLLRTAVIDGSLEAGASLPSTRGLAVDIGASRGLVVDAYAQLIAEGHLVATRGGGHRVAERSGAGRAPTGAGSGPAEPGAGRRAPIPVTQLAGHNPGQPDTALFPRRDWLRAMTTVMARTPDAAFAYGDARGTVELRRSLVSYLGRVRSIITDPDRVVIVNGFAQSAACLAQVLHRRDPGAVLAVEDPGSAGLVAQLTWWGTRIAHIPVDEGGIDVAALDRTSARAVIVTPAHQYPTGVTLSAERRHALLEWAHRNDALIVEDDYDAEYRYDREPLTSLHALGPDHVIAAGSTSKSLSPSLRLGWMVAPDHLVGPLAEAKANMDLGAAVLPQLALAELIDSGAMDRHLRRTPARYRQRRDALVDTLRVRAPHVDVAGIAAGLHVLVRLHPAIDAATDGAGDGESDEQRLARYARRLGFAAQPLDRYRHRSGPPGLVLGYAALRPETIRAAAARLAAVLT